MVMTDAIHDRDCYYNSYLEKNEPVDFSPIDLYCRCQEIDLTLGHRYNKSEMYKLYVPMGSLHPATFKALGHLLWSWRGLKVAKR